MISSISSCIVDVLIRNEIILSEQASAYQYGFEIFISSTLTCVITIICGLVLNCLSAALLYFGLFVILRTICGGYHAKTYWQCNLIFTLVTISVLLIFKLTTVEQFKELHYCIIILSVLVTGIYAPVENENKPLTTKQKKTFRILGMALILMSTIVSCVLSIKYSSSYSILIDLTVLAVSVSMFITEPMRGAA